MTDVPISAQPPTPPVAAALGELQRFAYEIAFELPCAPPRAWISLVHDIDRWWSYRLRDRTRVIMEAECGGRWMQVWDNGGALFGQFTVFDPPTLLCVTGPLAMTRPAFNWLEFAFEPSGQGTRLTLRHSALGEFDPDTASIYENGWQELIGVALTDYIRRGT